MRALKNWGIEARCQNAQENPTDLEEWLRKGAARDLSLKEECSVWGPENRTNRESNSLH